MCFKVKFFVMNDNCKFKFLAPENSLITFQIINGRGRKTGNLAGWCVAHQNCFPNWRPGTAENAFATRQIGSLRGQDLVQNVTGTQCLYKITGTILQNINPIMSQWTKRSSFEDLLLLVYGSLDGHKPLYTLRLHIDMFCDALKL